MDNLGLEYPVEDAEYPEEIEIKLIEVYQPERMLDARSKTAMLTVATWADFYRIGESWQDLQRWRAWEHGKRVNEVSHLGEYTTVQGDVLGVCSFDSDDVVCQVQVLEIRMVDCEALDDAEIRELGYRSRQEYDTFWRSMVEDSQRAWFMSVMLLADMNSAIH